MKLNYLHADYSEGRDSRFWGEVEYVGSLDRFHWSLTDCAAGEHLCDGYESTLERAERAMLEALAERQAANAEQ